jgi:hypothetical protein
MKKKDQRCGVLLDKNFYYKQLDEMKELKELLEDSDSHNSKLLIELDNAQRLIGKLLLIADSRGFELDGDNGK